MPDGVIVAVDAGGTKTHAMVCDVAGHVLGFGSSGTGNWESVGLDGMRAAFDEAIGGALDGASARRRDVLASGYGLAGLDWPSDIAMLDEAVSQLKLTGPRVLVNDSFIALRAGCRESHGIASNAGTGTVTAGRNRAGRTFRTMAIGYGERGGAGDLVAAAADAIAAAHHGWAPSTVLAERFLSVLGFETVEALFEAASRQDLEVGSELAPHVLAVAHQGDPVAIGIAAELGRDLALSVEGIARRLEMLDDSFELICFGGVHSAGSTVLDDAFASAVGAACPGATIVALEAPPVVGAALLALERIVPVDPGLHDRLAGEATSAREARG